MEEIKLPSAVVTNEGVINEDINIDLGKELLADLDETGKQPTNNVDDANQAKKDTDERHQLAQRFMVAN
jgi:hypothetical protein